MNEQRGDSARLVTARFVRRVGGLVGVILVGRPELELSVRRF